MYNGDSISSINPSFGSYTAATNGVANQPVGESYQLFGAKPTDLPIKDKKYLTTLQQDKAKTLASLQEDLASLHSGMSDEEKAMAETMIASQIEQLSCLDAAMDEVTTQQGTQGKGALSAAINKCNDPAKLNQLFRQRGEYAKHLVDIQKTLESADAAKLSEKDKKHAYQMMDFYRSNLS